LLKKGLVDTQEIVDQLLSRAVELDDGRPKDDISVMAIAVVDKSGDDVRRLYGRIPF
jgi:hypothetical protein